MESRLNKYETKTDTSGLTRAQKNAELYNEISNYNVSNFDVNSNCIFVPHLTQARKEQQY